MPSPRNEIASACFARLAMTALKALLSPPPGSISLAMIKRAFLVALIAGALLVPPARAAEEAAPFDGQLMRLSEILGGLHYLRGLCNPNEGQKWRNQMQALLDAEAPAGSPRRAHMMASFNRGYREAIARDGDGGIERHFVILPFAARWLVPAELAGLETTEGLAEIVRAAFELAG